MSRCCQYPVQEVCFFQSNLLIITFACNYFAQAIAFFADLIAICVNASSNVRVTPQLEGADAGVGVHVFACDACTLALSHNSSQH